MIKTFKCGLCREHRGEKYIGTRRGLREHLRKEHNVTKELTNAEGVINDKKIKRSWWKDEDFK